jgi:hypothetical protein
MKTICANYLNGMARFATVITTLIVGMTFALTTSVASAGEIKKVVIEKPKVVEKVVLPEKKAVVFPVAKEVVKPEAKSDFAVRPFFFRPFFRPFFNPFFDVDFD